RKTRGPPFGSDLGRGLALGGGPRVQALEVQDDLGQPQVRQVQELTDFMERLVRREQLSEDLRVSDPHSEKEEEEEEEEKDQLSEDLRRLQMVAGGRATTGLQLTEDRGRRSALRSQDIVPYFHPENAQLHQELLLLLGEGPDMKRLSLELPRPPKPSVSGLPLTEDPRGN
ncbi:hypothetical protein CRUP_004646, partial [Coryphaenoides rupestris]